jgi:ABC-type multidrug transport system fused ATPase/permease subunit
VLLRSGAGKSSIMQALFRIVEIDRGDVVVDGLNAKAVPLRLLRSRLAIIPQVPERSLTHIPLNLLI